MKNGRSRHFAKLEKLFNDNCAFSFVSVGCTSEGFQEPCAHASHCTTVLHECLMLPREFALLQIYTSLRVRRTALDFRRIRS